jgi:hypothetical protein
MFLPGSTGPDGTENEPCRTLQNRVEPSRTGNSGTFYSYWFLTFQGRQPPREGVVQWQKDCP